MKRQKLSVVAAVILLLAGMIIGCDTAANSGSGGTVSESDLYGTWTGTVPEMGNTVSLELKQDAAENSYKFTVWVTDTSDLWVKGTWQLGSSGTIVLDGGASSLSYELNNNKLKIWGDALSQFWGDSDIEITLSRTVSEADLYGTWTGTVPEMGNTVSLELKQDAAENSYKFTVWVTDTSDLWVKGTWQLGSSGTIVLDGGASSLSYELNNNRLKIWGEALSDLFYGAITQLDLTRK